MSTILHRPHGEYTLSVREIDDSTYSLMIIKNNPNSYVQPGYELEDFTTEMSAVRAAEHFPVMYSVAKEEGFELNQTEFRHKDGRWVHVSLALDYDRSPETFRQQLQGKIPF
jgi:hypothetical protein